MEEKAFLLKALREDGTAILNADDENILALGKYVKGNVIHYSVENPATISVENYGLMYEGDNLAGIQFRIKYDSNLIPVILKGVVGVQHVYPVLASACVGLVLKLPLVKLTEAFVKHEYPRGRMNILKGLNNSMIIDDTYNSSPVALEFGLKTLKDVIVKGRKIAVLGDMLELGSYSVNSHKEAGKLVAKCADILITVGVRARDFKESAIDAGMSEKNTKSFSNSIDAGLFLKDYLKEGDIVLAKGSQSMRMEMVVAEIIEDKENIKKLLVRQEGEWKVR
jgi:UDP-N-acetylmuramoyl-tripeptide--D-alanyl-D-alanine ligase